MIGIVTASFFQYSRVYVGRAALCYHVMSDRERNARDLRARSAIDYEAVKL